jgi:hypothetical protein
MGLYDRNSVSVLHGLWKATWLLSFLYLINPHIYIKSLIQAETDLGKDLNENERFQYSTVRGILAFFIP